MYLGVVLSVVLSAVVALTGSLSEMKPKDAVSPDGEQLTLQPADLCAVS